MSQEIRQKLTGHASASMNEIYTHRDLDPLRKAVALLPKIHLGMTEETEFDAAEEARVQVSEQQESLTRNMRTLHACLSNRIRGVKLITERRDWIAQYNGLEILRSPGRTQEEGREVLIAESQKGVSPAQIDNPPPRRIRCVVESGEIAYGG